MSIASMFKLALLLGVVALAILNGIHSPLFLFFVFYQYYWYPQMLPANPTAIFTLASLFIAASYAMVSGVPAALYERLFCNGQASVASRLIWLAVIGLMSVPSLGNMLRWMGLS